MALRNSPGEARGHGAVLEGQAMTIVALAARGELAGRPAGVDDERRRARR